MKPFVTVSSVMAPLPISNIDTDKIIPGRFLKTVSRSGLGTKLFHDLRFDDTGVKRDDHILNRSPWDKAQILIALDNFGCGSSREHAVWSLVDFGVRCILAPSFADIFEANCFKNGLLPIVQPRSVIDVLLQAATDRQGCIATISLEKKEISLARGMSFGFDIDPIRRSALLVGLDEIGTTLQREVQISQWELSNL